MNDFGSFRTERLRVEDWTRDLADPARRRAVEPDIASFLTPAVLAPLPPALRRDTAPDRIALWIDARAKESAVSVIRLSDSGPAAGLLIRAPGGANCHIGYLLAQSLWGRGFATEMLRGLVAARGDGAVTLVAGVGRGNPASVRALEKAGFLRDTDACTEETDRYSLPPCTH